MDVVIVPSNDKSLYRPKPGQFGCYRSRSKDSLTWHSCREVFHSKVSAWSQIAIGNGFFYSCVKSQRDATVEFINIIEDILDLRLKTVISKTNIPEVLHIKPSLFWCLQKMRFELFTVLLRSALEHKNGNEISIALNESYYSKRTLPAITRFLNGATYCTIGGDGWVRSTEHANLINILVPPWQGIFGIYRFMRIGRWMKRRFVAMWKACFGFKWIKRNAIDVYEVFKI